MAEEDKKAKTWEEVRKLFYCTHQQAHANIVDKEEAHQYIETHGLKALYQGELKDDTPRRLWLLTDPEGHTCGRLYTARGTQGYKNKESFVKDIFDFMEVFIPRQDYVKDDPNNYPRTGAFASDPTEVK